MFGKHFTTILIFAAHLHVVGATAVRAVEPVDIGSRRELLIDRHIVDTLHGTQMLLNRPSDRGVAVPLDQPWEGAFSFYTTIIKDGDTFRAYYRGLPVPGGDQRGEIEVTCVAESSDGIHWTKPELGLFEVCGTKSNNVVMAGMSPFAHNFSPMLDTRPGVPADRRYKALSGPSSGLVAFSSADGLRWTKWQEKPVIPRRPEEPHFGKGIFDAQNVPFWSEFENQYVCYFRVLVDGYRSVARTTSKDFLNWTRPIVMKFDDGPPEQIYVNQTSPYFRAPHLYIGLAARLVQGRRAITPEEAEVIDVHPNYVNDCSEGILITTRGGDDYYSRTFLEGFIRPGIGPENWVSRTNYPAMNVVQTSEHTLSIYVNQNYGQPTAHLRRYEIRLDGFASVRAPFSGGEMITKPITFTGNRLELNFATSAAGRIRVEIQDVNGDPIPGFTLEDCQDIVGNRISQTVAWTGGSNVGALAGTPIRLRFKMQDADLYALQFSVR